MDDVAAAFDPQLMFDFPDPYPMFAEMRRAQPVAHFTMLGRENYVVTRDDVITKLVTGTVDGVGLTDDEVISFLRLLLPAGAETTSRLMGSMFFALLADREERLERVRADRALAPWAVEETLRWETPVLFVARQATRPTEIAGVPIPEGKVVSAVIASGNRDEAHYPDPDRFDLDRRADDHLSFGFGRHF